MFNFVVTEYGIFEIRGWDDRPDKKSLSIGFFTNDLNHPAAFLSTKLKKLVEDGKVIGKIASRESGYFSKKLQNCLNEE
jgi:hypothetical protein